MSLCNVTESRGCANLVVLDELLDPGLVAEAKGVVRAPGHQDDVGPLLLLTQHILHNKCTMNIKECIKKDF
jgi:hypothetical protein